MDQIHIATKHTAPQHFAHLPMPTAAAPASKPAAANDLAAVPTTAAPATTPPATPSLNGTTAAAITTTNNPAGTAAKAPALIPILLPVPDREDNSSEAIRQTARQQYLKTLADGLPCTGRELAEMFGMSERWGHYQIRAARQAITTTVHTAQETPSSAPGA